ncbi:MAG TPA: bifunctional shikimate kinase/3-dehydroquinate synthase [Solirubrobacteraceae bacterium]|nr:bifunctional shikimate kinase/3-dehydroquinate synthase [Solirubrobacteraceae bacterium]
MGAGKTTAARELAAGRSLRVSDVDQLIEARGTGTIAEIFERDGEGAFRALEEEVVCELLARARQGEVISLSGGAVGSERVRAALTGHVVVWLDIEPTLAWRRVGAGSRPLARDRAAFDERYEARLPLYASLADAVIPSTARAALPRAYDAVEQLRHAPTGTRLLWAVSGSAEYPVWIGRGLLGSAVWPLARPPSRRFCVTDEHVGPLWRERAGEFDGQIVIAAGERSKSLESAERVWRELARAGMTRADHLVALGGGVVGDLAGFCAATYQRGVPVVQLPTTLAAQVDSAYGGKTGVDLPEGKNYVGVYHQPAGVLVDPGTLATLPAAELSAGYAEVIKTALIAGGALWERIAADRPIDDDVIFECARCKLAIVGEDERDEGPRQVLNLGHTVAHAIETVTDYRRYRHGEAVGLGLLAALELSGAADLRAQVRRLLEAHGLPTRADGLDPAAVVEATGRDKKRMGASVPFVLVDAPGAVRHGAEVSREQLEAAVTELCR